MRRTFAGLVVAALLVLGLAPGLVSAGEYSPGSASLGDPYFPGDGNGGYDVQSYDLKLRYDPASDVLKATATIRARATKNLSRFNLDFVGLHLRHADVNGRDARTRRDGQELIVTPKKGIPKGSTFTAVFRYDGVPEPVEDVFGTSGFIATEDGAIVMGEPHVAATWFPANDHPRDKAKFHFRITVPKGLEAIANGVLVRKSTSGHWSTWEWDAKEPMATYLATMAVGQFDIDAYREAGIRYWDAIDSRLLEDLLPEATPTDGSQLLFSDVGEPSYK
jgi:aminopeptidase N